VQGNVALFERHRANAEQVAIQQGTSWQIETWAPSATTFIAFRAHDGMAPKRASMARFVGLPARSWMASFRGAG
jgi:hypothetical protein